MHEDILLWAAGRDLSPNAVTPSAWPAILRRVQGHRLSARLKSRLDAESPSWLTEEMANDLEVDVQLYRRLLTEYTEQVHKIDAILALEQAPPIILIKGETAWANTGNPSQIVRTSDIDALSAQPQRIYKALSRGGYHELTDRMPHEYANLVADNLDWEVDLHSVFPVWGYESPADPNREPKGVHIGSVGRSLTFGDLDEEVLIEHAVNRFGTKHGRVLVPDVTDCVLIRCAHIMHDYAEPPYYLTDGMFGKLRFFELSEIRELSRDPSFDKDRFLSSVQRVDGGDALALVEQLFQVVFGSNFLKSGQREASILPPLQLCWGITVEPSRSPGQVLYQEDETLDELFEEHPPTRLTLAVDDEIVVASRTGAAATTFDRVLTNWSAGHSLNVQVCAQRLPEALRLDVIVEGPLGPFLEEVELIFASTRLYAAYEVSRDAYRNPDPDIWGTVLWEFSPDGYTVHLEIPWDTVESLKHPRGNRLDLVLAVERFETTVGHDWTEFFDTGMTSTAMPISVELPPQGNVRRDR